MRLLYTLSSALALILAASVVHAHVRIQPAEARAGAQQTYTVHVPTEGDVATSSIELEIPTGVSVISVEGAAETKRTGDRITSIVWKMEIPPGQSRDFVFVATNPATSEEISWKAHQNYVDGSSANWVEGPGSRRPASVTKLR